MFYQILKLVEREAQRQINSMHIGAEYSKALYDLIVALNKVMRFN